MEGKWDKKEREKNKDAARKRWREIGGKGKKFSWKRELNKEWKTEKELSPPLPKKSKIERERERERERETERQRERMCAFVFVCIQVNKKKIENFWRRRADMKWKKEIVIQ